MVAADVKNDDDKFPWDYDKFTIITGPTGSGKTTALMTLLDTLKNDGYLDHINGKILIVGAYTLSESNRDFYNSNKIMSFFKHAEDESPIYLQANTLDSQLIQQIKKFLPGNDPELGLYTSTGGSNIYTRHEPIPEHVDWTDHEVSTGKWKPVDEILSRFKPEVGDNYLRVKNPDAQTTTPTTTTTTTTAPPVSSQSRKVKRRNMIIMDDVEVPAMGRQTRKRRIPCPVAKKPKLDADVPKAGGSCTLYAEEEDEAPRINDHGAQCAFLGATLHHTRSNLIQLRTSMSGNNINHIMDQVQFLGVPTYGRVPFKFINTFFTRNNLTRGRGRPSGGRDVLSPEECYEKYLTDAIDAGGQLLWWSKSQCSRTKKDGMALPAPWVLTQA